MKKVVFIVLLSVFILGVKFSSMAQVFEGPRDAIYDKPPDGKNTISQVDPIPYSYLRETDVIWSRRIWRELDLHEKLNQPFYYPEKPQSGWKSFAQIILDAVHEGTITAYSPETDDQFIVPITYKELMDKFRKESKTTLSRPDDPDVKFDTTIVQDFEAKDVKRLRIKEDWVFDKQRSVQEGRILGICLMKANVDDKGEYRGESKVCWVYFPDCRKLLSNNQQFNLKNGVAGRLSYDEVFMKRMFASYIIKYENVYDRSISEYESGIGALLEAEKAKTSLFDFEQNAWEY